MLYEVITSVIDVEDKSLIAKYTIDKSKPDEYFDIKEGCFIENLLSSTLS